tara:strand:+ start:305 stop:691 length:387 start_codon:yes stop_codon:yes gene_type:complete
MKNSNNPLSPHLQIYKWQLSSLISIFHRITSIINTIVLLFICFWISSMFFGENFYQKIHIFMDSFFGKFMILGITWSFSFHFLSGIRHLIWDFGYGYDLKKSNISGTLVIFFSFILTIILYLIGRYFV